MIWSYSLCDFCLNNAHEKVKMVRQNLISTYDNKSSGEYWVCPKCGSTKKF